MAQQTLEIALDKLVKSIEIQSIERDLRKEIISDTTEPLFDLIAENPFADNSLGDQLAIDIVELFGIL